MTEGPYEDVERPSAEPMDANLARPMTGPAGTTEDAEPPGPVRADVEADVVEGSSSEI